MDINNIVESNHYTRVSNWCKLGVGKKKCRGPARMVKPYRCLGELISTDSNFAVMAYSGITCSY